MDELLFQLISYETFQQNSDQKSKWLEIPKMHLNEKFGLIENVKKSILHFNENLLEPLKFNQINLPKNNTNGRITVDFYKIMFH